jgi:hypothetical protein
MSVPRGSVVGNTLNGVIAVLAMIVAGKINTLEKYALRNNYGAFAII